MSSGFLHDKNKNRIITTNPFDIARERFLDGPTKVFRLCIPEIDRSYSREIEIAMNATELGGGVCGIICAKIRYAFRNVPCENVVVVTKLTRKILETHRDYDSECLNADVGDINILTSLIRDCHTNIDERSIENLSRVIGMVRSKDYYAVCFGCFDGFAEISYAFTEISLGLEYSFVIVYDNGDKYTNMSAKDTVQFAPLIITYSEDVRIVAMARVADDRKHVDKPESIALYAQKLGINTSTLYYVNIIDIW